MRNEYKGVVLNDLSNLFIWSGFKYYLTKKTDSYILYSPTKYWRNQSLVNKEFGGGFLCNRQEFHASQCSAIGCIWWKNIDDFSTEELTLTPFSIVSDTVRRASEDLVIKKAYHNLSEAYDKRSFENDREDGIICERNGQEFIDNGIIRYIAPVFNQNIIAYLMASNFQIDRKDVALTRCGLYKAHGFFLRADNYLDKLPLFVAAAFPYDKWYKADVYSKSYDGQGSYLEDREFIKRCLIYTSLTPKNKCRSLIGSDGRFYRNELCFDNNDTLAYQSLQELEQSGTNLTDDENTLLKYWSDVKFEVEKTEEYKSAVKSNANLRYGLWQIMEEINIKIDSGRRDRKGEPVMVYKYTTLNTEIKKLDNAVKAYYDKNLIPLLFKYELIK